MEFELGERPVTIGRSPEADVVILDEKVSRIHCGIRYWDGDFYIKDLKSKNGTYVNDRRIDVAKLQPGDRIRVGSVILVFEQEGPAVPEKALEEVSQELAQGKGYSTILREIVQSADDAGASAVRTRDTSAGDEPAIRIKTKKPGK